ncbi:MAG: protein pelota [Candidatus Woesearchaeota archaeon]|nr:protein pelota [Candidatus Woesearchaeota archaeon]MDN5327960.1 protein pelota [Candidatus Woesearchaeota archaeon]
MKVLKEDFKNKEFVFLIDNDDDLWNLYLMISKDDLVSGKAYRKISLENSKEVKKIVFFTTLQVEKVEYKGNQLKILGKTLLEHEDVPKNSYQSINVESGDKIELKKKEINSYFKDKLEESKKAKYVFLIALFDRNDWLFAEATNSGIKILSKKSFPSSKRINEDKEYYTEFIKEIKSFLTTKNVDAVIIGCSFLFKNKLKELAERELSNKVIFTSISSINESGLREVLLSDEIKQEVSKLKIASDLKKVDEVLVRISKNDKIAYGFNEVKNAASIGAVDELIVSEKKIIELKNEDNFEELNEIMNLVEQMNGKVTVITPEASKQLDALGGIAAILRYDIN